MTVLGSRFWVSTCINSRYIYVCMLCLKRCVRPMRWGNATDFKSETCTSLVKVPTALPQLSEVYALRCSPRRATTFTSELFKKTSQKKKVRCAYIYLNQFIVWQTYYTIEQGFSLNRTRITDLTELSKGT